MVKLYDDVVAVTDAYFGPTADKFVTRQIRSHLQKDAATLQPADLGQLIDWIRLAMRMASNDHAVVDRYIAELQELAHPKGREIHAKQAS